MFQNWSDVEAWISTADVVEWFDPHGLVNTGVKNQVTEGHKDVVKRFWWGEMANGVECGLVTIDELGLGPDWSYTPTNIYYEKQP